MAQLDREKLALVLADSIGGFESLESVDRLSGGASQETYRIEIETGEGAKTLCLRRAAGGIERDEASVERSSPGLRTEALLMQAAARAGIPEPEVYHVLESKDGLGDGFLMEWLDGETLGPRIVRSDRWAAVRPKLAFEYGAIAARIHSLDLDEGGLRQRLGELPPDDFLHQTWERYKVLDTPQPMIDYVGRWLEEHLPTENRTTLVHNDYRNGNVMISNQGVVAVLDWEIAHIGDPMRDLGWMCCNSWRFGNTEMAVGGVGTREQLFAGYESVSGVPVDPDHVKWWEVFGSFWWATGCLGMAQHYRTGPDKSVERPAIGRRTSECQVDCVNLLMPGPVELVQASEPTAIDMPRLDELVGSVRDFLRGDVMAETQGRTNFLARVAGNSLDIVSRDLHLGEEHRRNEHQRLRSVLDSDGSLIDLRWKLALGLRDGSIPLDHSGLEEHLRTTVVNQIAIDQPRYSGFKTARDGKKGP